ncbi:MAPEG family protein [Sorangium sp. So ce124]
MNTIFWLFAPVALTACLWVPYVLDRMVRLGLARTFATPAPGNDAEQSAWALRAKAAHANAVESLVLFAPLALLVAELGAASTPLASTAAATYFFRASRTSGSTRRGSRSCAHWRSSRASGRRWRCCSRP